MTYWECDNCEFVTTSEKEADDHVELTDHIMSWMYDDDLTPQLAAARKAQLQQTAS